LSSHADNQASNKDNLQLLREILDELITRNPNVINAMVVSDDGLNVASGIPHSGDDSVALTASDLVDTAKTFSERLEQGRMNRILLEGSQRTTVVLSAGKRTVLVVSVPADEKLGLVSLAMRRAADQVAAIFG
jgi:predicted regulator of Ras-like GTPase activity (Roadblock/LC7/MglB family)